MTRARLIQSLRLGALPIVALLLAWQAAAVAGLAPPALLPRPGEVLARLLSQAADREFLGHLAATLRRLALGVAIAIAVGVPLGLWAGTDRRVDRLIRPLLRILAPVPKIALYPVLILVLGYDDAPKIVLVAADAAFPILFATLGGAKAVEPKLVWAARAAGVSRGRATLSVVLPATLPAILTGCRIGLVVACIVVFLAEMITSTDGLGWVLANAARTFRAVDMFVPLVTISLLGLLLNGLLALARRRLLRGYADGA